MNKIEQIELRFNKCKERLQEYLKQLKTRKIELKNYYMQTYRNRNTYDSEGKLIKFVLWRQTPKSKSLKRISGLM